MTENTPVCSLNFSGTELPHEPEYFTLHCMRGEKQYIHIYTHTYIYTVVGKLLFKNSGVTILPLLVKVTRYYYAVIHFSL
jgi:hypothetical protein